MTGDVEVQDSAAPVLNDEKAIKEFEGQCGHGEEINGNDCLAMITEEGKPALAGIAVASQPSQISGNSPLADLEPKLQQFAMDLRRAPA